MGQFGEGLDDVALNLRSAGLLANNLLASENAGAPNELYLARWYLTRWS